MDASNGTEGAIREFQEDSMDFAEHDDNDYDDEKVATQMTCEMLCSLGGSCSSPQRGKSDSSTEGSRKKSGKSCPKQLQLPMFLSKTYHMIDRCDGNIASWSHDGQSFVVKNTETFATKVLPLYFKHSNFSSFARQLNFYGFRKLRTDPILTSDVDPQTANHVRFYHEKFQKDKPELLHQIKRATKTDQHSKDELDSLRQEVSRLKDTLNMTVIQYDQKLAELSYEYNRRITSMNAEFDKLTSIVHQFIGAKTSAPGALASSSIPGTSGPVQPGQVPDLLHSLSQAAVSLQSQTALNLQNPLNSSQSQSKAANPPNGKRPAEENLGQKRKKAG